VNVETLAKRGQAAINSNMLGSARQYYEKSIKALEAQNNQGEYCVQKSTEYRAKLS
jgi:poly-D-alanine transfer protein DltD